MLQQVYDNNATVTSHALASHRAEVNASARSVLPTTYSFETVMILASVASRPGEPTRDRVGMGSASFARRHHKVLYQTRRGIRTTSTPQAFVNWVPIVCQSPKHKRARQVRQVTSLSLLVRCRVCFVHPSRRTYKVDSARTLISAAAD